MKKIILFALLSAVTVTVPAQKIWSTRTGQVKFFSKTPGEDIEAVNNEVDSKIAQANGQMVFSILIKGFRFPNALMQEHFNENYMESTKFPRAEFKGFIINNASVNYAKDGNYNATAEGNITIHGVTKKVTIPGTIEVKAGKITGKSVFKIRLKDYQIKGSAIGDTVAPEIEITVNCKYQ